MFQVLKPPLRALHAGDGRARRAACRGERFLEVADTFCTASGPREDGRRSATPSGGRSTRWACRSSAPPPSCSSCSATSGGRGAGSWRSVATRRSRARRTSRRSTTCSRAICRCRPSRRTTQSLERYLDDAPHARRRGGRNLPKYVVSLLKAFYGDAATPENEFGFDWLPRITGDHSHLAYWHGNGGRARSRACSSWDRTPRWARQRRGSSARALARLKWLVVRDLVEIETRVLLAGLAGDRER